MSHPHHAPELPEVIDEAGDTPGWVPVLGVVLFVLMVAYVWWAHRQHEALEDGSTPAAEQP
jgi:protein-S-isoprenylcysteine O-methyltransferase Ste14